MFQSPATAMGIYYHWKFFIDVYKRQSDSFLHAIRLLLPLWQQQTIIRSLGNVPICVSSSSKEMCIRDSFLIIISHISLVAQFVAVYFSSK